nr:J domain-containing protein spf31-like isoform X2 [Ipomoea batatas]
MLVVSCCSIKYPVEERDNHPERETRLPRIPAEGLYEKNLNNLGHVKEIHELKGRTMLFKISAKKEHYVRRNIPFPVVKIKTDQLLLQQLCPDLLALDENEFNSDGPSSEGDDKFLEFIGVHLAKKSFSRHGNGPVQSMPPISSQVLADTPTNLRDAINLTSSVNTTGQACRARSSQPFQVNTTNCHAIGQLRSQNLTTGQACRARSSQPFQVNTTNCHAIGQLRSQNLTTETRVATNRMMSNTRIHPVRNLEEEFSATLQDTSKVMQASLALAKTQQLLLDPQERDYILNQVNAAKDIKIAVIARSVGVGENYKKLCTFDEVTIWEANGKSKSL